MGVDAAGESQGARGLAALMAPSARLACPELSVPSYLKRKSLRVAVGGRASGAPISIDKASLRAVFRGGSFVDGCGIAAQSVPWRCLRLYAAGGLLLAACGEKLVSPHAKGLCSGET